MEQILRRRIGAEPIAQQAIMIDHNHVVGEIHDGAFLWVHRKGAMPAQAGLAGVVPGSMGTPSYHVVGRGCCRSLCSSAHGAGRRLSREVAHRAIPPRLLQQQMKGVWYDYRRSDALRQEAPGAYKDIRAVLRAQHDLVRISRVLKPLLSFKGR